MKAGISMVVALAFSSVSWPALADFGDVDPGYSPFNGGCEAIATREDGGAYASSPNPSGIAVTRLTAQGTPDTRWGIGGQVALPAAQYTRVGQLLRGKDGDLFVVESNYLLRSGGIDHILPDGTLDMSFGNAGRLSLPLVLSAALQGDGKVAALIVELNASATFVRYTARGLPDPEFGHSGALYVPNLLASSETLYGWGISSDGHPEIGTFTATLDSISPRLLIATDDFQSVSAAGGRLVPQGVATWMSPLAKVDPTGGLVLVSATSISRFRADGSLDGGFGSFGWPSFGQITFPSALWREPDGSWTLTGIGKDYSGFALYVGDNYLRAIRFDANGVRNTQFGVKQFGGVKGSNVSGELAVRAADGSVLFSDEVCTLHRHLVDSPRVEGKIVEYYHADLDHYFMTSSPNEIAGVDANPLGWLRTGETFGDWTPANLPGAAHVCRFYGDPVIGPNSHFYTAEDFECQGLIALQAGAPPGVPVWHLEAKPFDIAIPASGTCPENLQPVYRVFNGPASNGHGPNHRYTTDPAVYAAMQAKGWIPEGVHFCAPPRVN